MIAVAVTSFLMLLSRSKYDLIALNGHDIDRTAHLLEQYADSRVDFVDSTVVALAERLNITTVLTLDRRDFSLVRPRHVNTLTLLPD